MVDEIKSKYNFEPKTSQITIYFSFPTGTSIQVLSILSERKNTYQDHKKIFLNRCVVNDCEVFSGHIGTPDITGNWYSPSCFTELRLHGRVW